MHVQRFFLKFKHSEMVTKFGKKFPLYSKKLYICFRFIKFVLRNENRTLILLWFWFQTYHWDKVLKQHWRHQCTVVHFWNHRLDQNVKYYRITYLKGGYSKGGTTKIKRGSTKEESTKGGSIKMKRGSTKEESTKGGSTKEEATKGGSKYQERIAIFVILFIWYHWWSARSLYQMHCGSHIMIWNLANHMKKVKQRTSNCC